MEIIDDIVTGVRSFFGMKTHSIEIDNDAYALLEKAWREGESYSDVIRRFAGSRAGRVRAARAKVQDWTPAYVKKEYGITIETALKKRKQVERELASDERAGLVKTGTIESLADLRKEFDDAV